MAFIHSIPAGVAIVVYAIVYQQLENHVLQPLIIGRAVRLTPPSTMVAALVGGLAAGVLLRCGAARVGVGGGA